MGLGYAHTRTEVGGLDKAVIAQLSLDTGQHLVGLALPGLAQDDNVRNHWHFVCLHDVLEQHLVHTHCRRGNPGPHIGNACQFQQTLNRAILAIGTVEDRKDDVQVADLHGGQCLLPLHVLQAHQATLRWFSQEKGGIALCHCPRTQCFEGIARSQPAAFLGDADRHDLVLGLVYGIHHALGRRERNLVLARTSSKDKSYPQCFWHARFYHNL